MTCATEPLAPTVEECVRAAQGVVLLVADLLALQTVAPDDARQLSSAAAATLAPAAASMGRICSGCWPACPAEVVHTTGVSPRRRRTRPVTPDSP